MATSVSSYDGSVGKDENVDRLFKNFTFKCLQVIVQSRIENGNARPTKDSSSDYFCITIPDNPSIEEQIKKVFDGVKSFPVKDHSICVEIPLITNDGDHMFLEAWDLSFNLSSLDMSANRIQHIFTRMGVTLKSLMSATRAMPAYRLARNQGEKGGGYKLSYRFYLGKPQTHLLGEGFKTVRAGSVPTAHGLLTINASFRTQLLLSPEMSASAMAAIEVTDNYFVQEYRRASDVPAVSDPQPCSSPLHRSASNRSDSPYCFAVSPSSMEREDNEMRARMARENAVFSQSSIFNMEELPEPVVGAFASQRPSQQKNLDHEVPFEGLMRRSMMARQEQQMAAAARRGVERNGEDNADSAAIRKKEGRQCERVDEDEKENNPDSGQEIIRGQKMAMEDEFVMVDKPPFAADDDPRDVKAFLGVMFRAPNLYEAQDNKVSVVDYLNDVGDLVSKLEEDMPVLDEFCQSVINLNSQEEDGDENPLFS